MVAGEDVVLEDCSRDVVRLVVLVALGATALVDVTTTTVLVDGSAGVGAVAAEDGVGSGSVCVRDRLVLVVGSGSSLLVLGDFGSSKLVRKPAIGANASSAMFATHLWQRGICDSRPRIHLETLRFVLASCRAMPSSIVQWRMDNFIDFRAKDMSITEREVSFEMSLDWPCIWLARLQMFQ